MTLTKLTRAERRDRRALVQTGILRNPWLSPVHARAIADAVMEMDAEVFRVFLDLTQTAEAPSDDLFEGLSTWIHTAYAAVLTPPDPDVLLNQFQRGEIDLQDPMGAVHWMAHPEFAGRTKAAVEEKLGHQVRPLSEGQR